MSKYVETEEEARFWRSIIAEINEGGARGLWSGDELTADDLQAAAALGVKPEQMIRAAVAHTPYEPPRRTPRAKSYRDMDDDEFDDVWNPDRGSQCGLPI